MLGRVTQAPVDGLSVGSVRAVHENVYSYHSHDGVKSASPVRGGLQECVGIYGPTARTPHGSSSPCRGARPASIAKQTRKRGCRGRPNAYDVEDQSLTRRAEDYPRATMYGWATK